MAYDGPAQRPDRRRTVVFAIPVHVPQRGIGVHEFALGRPQRHAVDGRVEHRAVLLLARAQRRFGRLAVGDVARQRQRHGVERAAQAAEFVGTLEAAARREVARRDLLRRAHQPRRAPRQQEVEDQPHRERQRRHPSGPVQRLPDDLRARLRLVALEIVGEEQAAGARRPQLFAGAAHQHARVAQQLVAAGVASSARRGVRESRRRPARCRTAAGTPRSPCRATRGGSRR